MSVAALVGTCDLIWVDGPDAEGFLHGLVTNDVAALPTGQACRALLLDQSGHIQADMRVARTGTSDFTLVVAATQGESLVALLDRFHFSEDVDIIGPETVACVTLVDVDAPPTEGVDLAVPGLLPGTIDAIGVDADAIVAAAGAEPADPEALEARRIAAGVPLFGVDFTSANLVQEAALEDSAVSFDKGCYLGQETVARVHYRGRVNRRLRGLSLDGPAAVGAELRVADRTVGVLTSVADDPTHGHIGLALVRREAEDAGVLDVQDSGTRATFVQLPLQNDHKPSVRIPRLETS